MIKLPTPKGGSVRYPWDNWLSHDRFCLEQDKHYKCSSTALVINLRKEAKKRNKRVSVAVSRTDRWEDNESRLVKAEQINVQVFPLTKRTSKKKK